MNRLSEFPFKNFIDDSGKLRYKNFVGMLTCLLISTACFNCFKQSGVAFLKTLYRKGVISGATHNDTLDLKVLGLSNSHSELNYFKSVAKS